MYNYKNNISSTLNFMAVFWERNVVPFLSDSPWSCFRILCYKDGSVSQWFSHMASSLHVRACCRLVNLRPSSALRNRLSKIFFLYPIMFTDLLPVNLISWKMFLKLFLFNITYFSSLFVALITTFWEMLLLLNSKWAQIFTKKSNVFIV